MSKKKEIPIVFATDANYVPYCGVAISSLIENSSPENNYYIYILYDILSKNSIYRLHLMKQDHVHIECICIHEYVNKLHVTEFNHLTVACVYRLIIAKLLSQYDKVLYLDSDIVVLYDIARMYEIDIGDNVLGVVHGFMPTELFREYTKDVLKIQEENFFNSGVLIINTKKFREHNIGELCFELLSSRTDLIYMDQCALNIVCEGKVKFIPKEWNYEWNVLFGPTIYWDKYRCDAPYIIHYDGGRKPWDYIDEIYAEVFWKYARKTIFYEEIVRRSNLKRMKEFMGIWNNGEVINSVAVYGAGLYGTKLVRKLKEFNLIKVVVWVDQRYQDIKSDIMPVSAVELLYTENYDYVFIAIKNKTIFEEVRDMLSKNGIAQEKIKRVILD